MCHLSFEARSIQWYTDKNSYRGSNLRVLRSCRLSARRQGRLGWQECVANGSRGWKCVGPTPSQDGAGDDADWPMVVGNGGENCRPTLLQGTLRKRQRVAYGKCTFGRRVYGTALGRRLGGSNVRCWAKEVRRHCAQRPSRKHSCCPRGDLQPSRRTQVH